MEVIIPFNGAAYAYEAEYRGLGQSKRAFLLSAPGQPFHQKILKLAANIDLEPSVFREMPADVTSEIYYEKTLAGI